MLSPGEAGGLDSKDFCAAMRKLVRAPVAAHRPHSTVTRRHKIFTLPYTSIVLPCSQAHQYSCSETTPPLLPITPPQSTFYTQIHPTTNSMQPLAPDRFHLHCTARNRRPLAGVLQLNPVTRPVMSRVSDERGSRHAAGSRERAGFQAAQARYRFRLRHLHPGQQSLRQRE